MTVVAACKCGSNERRPSATWRCGRGHFLPLRAYPPNTTLLAIPVSDELLPELLDRWVDVRGIRLHARDDGTVELQLRRGEREPGADDRVVSSGQVAAFNAKTTALATRYSVDRMAMKARLKQRAAEMFGRPIESTKDMTFDEMSVLLDWIEDALERPRARSGW